MVGLSAAELQTETLFPGDTIEYYSMAFVAGDRRGHRVSKILRVDRQDEDFPIRVDTQEMLPLTILIKRNRDRNDFNISSDDAKWRKLRTFKLVDGEVEGETRADRLNADLKTAFSDAMKATKKQLAKENAEKANAGSKKIMSMFFKKKAPAKVASSSSSSEDEEDDTNSSNKRASPVKQLKRKPLTPRHIRETSVNISPSADTSPRKNYTVEKKARADHHPPHRSDKYVSHKRKRSDATPPKAKYKELPRNKPHKSTSSKYFSAKDGHLRPKKNNGLLKFLNHIEEKKRDCDLNNYLAFEEKQVQAIERVTQADDDASGESTLEAPKVDSSRSGPSSSKLYWQQKRKQFRHTSGKSMELWLKGSKKRQDELEDVSAGTSAKAKTSNDASRLLHTLEKKKQRTLNLAPDEPSPSKKNRRSGLNFMMSDSSGDATHCGQEVISSKLSKTKKRRSLGTVSARSAKSSAKKEKHSFSNQWNHRR